ncbi:hypothetical protein JW865_08215 [Candidatus Bathyarchaeota archaeon]|nr:hypothetical protein [Candidatus Bathyarchaeota archaeon]
MVVSVSTLLGLRVYALFIILRVSIIRVKTRILGVRRGVFDERIVHSWVGYWWVVFVKDCF